MSRLHSALLPAAVLVGGVGLAAAPAQPAAAWCIGGVWGDTCVNQRISENRQADRLGQPEPRYTCVWIFCGRDRSGPKVKQRPRGPGGHWWSDPPDTRGNDSGDPPGGCGEVLGVKVKEC